MIGVDAARGRAGGKRPESAPHQQVLLHTRW
jgi:hypothetical protein